MDKIVGGQKVFFTADLHLGHKNIIGYCNRPFSTGGEMDAKIISSINETVGQNDILYVIGDFCHKGGTALSYRERIVCENVHIILGNHDEPTKFTSGFSSVSDQKMILYVNQKIFMCHYPMRSWSGSYRKSWMLYGHVHGRLHREDVASGTLTLDVGVDNKRDGVEFGTPWSFKDVQQQFLARTKKISRSPIDIDDTILYNRRNNAR
jgi:calcineurin-like phosphoesterase family protein